MKRLITPNHVLLPCPQLYTLISIFPDATPPPLAADTWYTGCSTTLGKAGDNPQQ